MRSGKQVLSSRFYQKSKSIPLGFVKYSAIIPLGFIKNCSNSFVIFIINYYLCHRYLKKISICT